MARARKSKRTDTIAHIVTLMGRRRKHILLTIVPLGVFVVAIFIWQIMANTGMITDDSILNNLVFRAVIYITAMVLAGVIGINAQKWARLSSEIEGNRQKYGITTEEIKDFEAGRS